MRLPDINGNYVANAVAFCHNSGHPGALTRKLAYEHKCMGKKCKYLEIYNQKAMQVKKYKNRR